ncbi:MAG: hypothetical protein CMQ40_01310 [Gammaproteobacteria bacterium]|nr:hypothetical protein [Gammaproteobacteria bacterium]|tara:strand:- start:2442 stop:3188 length:747 start_codon:yes stop_codon:yes gene_type:complete
MVKKKTYFVAGILIFITSLLVMMPARILSTNIERILSNQTDLQVGKISGTIWNGQIETKFKDLPKTTLSWDISFISLIIGRLQANGELNGEGIESAFSLLISSKKKEIKNLTAKIESHFLNELTIPYGLELSERFSLQMPFIYLSSEWITDLDGLVTWPGGTILIETPLQKHHVNLPKLKGKISLSEESILLDLSTEKINLMRINLTKTGWLKTEIENSFLTLANLPFLDKTLRKSESPALIIEEKIL